MLSGCVCRGRGLCYFKLNVTIWVLSGHWPNAVCSYLNIFLDVIWYLLELLWGRYLKTHWLLPELRWNSDGSRFHSLSIQHTLTNFHATLRSTQHDAALTICDPEQLFRFYLWSSNRDWFTIPWLIRIVVNYLLPSDYGAKPSSKSHDEISILNLFVGVWHHVTHCLSSGVCNPRRFNSTIEYLSNTRMFLVVWLLWLCALTCCPESLLSLFELRYHLDYSTAFEQIPSFN